MAAREITEQLRVVILYDRLESVGRAMAAYAHLTRELECECQPELTLWRLDVATTAEFAVKADFDIASADLVLMAVHGSEPCPAAFQHWQERAWQDEGAPARIWIAIVMAADEPAPVTTTWTHALRLSARQIHPEIFVWEPVSEFPALAPAPRVDRLERAAIHAATVTEDFRPEDVPPETISTDPRLVGALRE